MSVDLYDIDLAEKLKPGLNSMRVVIMMLPLGVLAFLGFAIAVRMGGKVRPITEGTNLLRWAAIGSAPLAYWLGRFMADLNTRGVCKQLAAGTHAAQHGVGPAGPPAFLADLGDAGVLFSAYQTQAIIKAACLEFAAFACVFSFQCTGSLASFALSFALPCAIVAMFPTAGRVAEWIEAQMQLVEQERRFVR